MLDPDPLRRAFPADATLSRWQAPDGWPLRSFDWHADGRRGRLLIQGGRGDIIEKYHAEEAVRVALMLGLRSPRRARLGSRAARSMASRGDPVRAAETGGKARLDTSRRRPLVTDADGLVDPKAARRSAARLPHAELVRFGGECAREILREADPVRDRALAAIDAFLDEHARA